MGQGTGRILALALGCVLAFVSGEIALRAWHALHGVPFFSFLPGARGERFPLSPFLVFGPRMDWQMEGKRHAETSYWNRQGFRTREILGPRPPGELRIVALGGSTTEDVWNEEGIHWPLVVEREIHAAGRRDVRIYNGAMSAYTTAHSLVRFAFDVLPVQPDMLLVMHNVNDLLVAYAAAREGVPVDPSYRVKYGRRDLTRDVDDRDVVLSRLWRAVAERGAALWAARGDARPMLRDDHDLAPALALFERNLASLAAVARAHGVQPVFLTMPVSRSREVFDDTARLAARGLLEAFPSYERFHADFEAYNDAIRRVGRERGVPVIDAVRLMPSEERFFADLVHTTSEGVTAMGRAVAPALLALLPPSRSPAD